MRAAQIILQSSNVYIILNLRTLFRVVHIIIITSIEKCPHLFVTFGQTIPVLHVLNERIFILLTFRLEAYFVQQMHLCSQWYL